MPGPESAAPAGPLFTASLPHGALELDVLKACLNRAARASGQVVLAVHEDRLAWDVRLPGQALPLQLVAPAEHFDQGSSCAVPRGQVRRFQLEVNEWLQALRADSAAKRPFHLSVIIGLQGPRAFLSGLADTVGRRTGTLLIELV